MSCSSDHHNHIHGHNSDCPGEKTDENQKKKTDEIQKKKTDPNQKKMSKLRSRSPSSECLSRCCSRSSSRSSRSSSSSSASSHSCSCSSCCSSGSSASSQSSSSSGSESSSSSDSECGHKEEKVTLIGSSAIRDNKSAKYVLSTTREPLKLTISKSSLGPNQHRSKIESHSLSSSLSKSPSTSRNRLGNNQSQCDQFSFNVSHREPNNVNSCGQNNVNNNYGQNNVNSYGQNNVNNYGQTNAKIYERKNGSVDMKSDDSSGNSKRIMSSAEERQKLRSFRINHVRNRSSNTQPLPTDQVSKPDLTRVPEPDLSRVAKPDLVRVPEPDLVRIPDASTLVKGQSTQCTIMESHEIPTVNRVSTVLKAGNSQVQNVVSRNGVNQINSPVTKSSIPPSVTKSSISSSATSSSIPSLVTSSLKPSSVITSSIPSSVTTSSISSSSTPIISPQIMSSPQLMLPIYSNSVQTNSQPNSNLIHSKESLSNPVLTRTTSIMSPLSVSDGKSIGRNVNSIGGKMNSIGGNVNSIGGNVNPIGGKMNPIGGKMNSIGVNVVEGKPPPLKSLKLMKGRNKSSFQSKDGKDGGTVDGEKRKLVVDESKLIGYRDLVEIPHNTHIAPRTETLSSIGPLPKTELLQAPSSVVTQLTSPVVAQLTSPVAAPVKKPEEADLSHSKPSSTNETKKRTLITKAARKCMSFSESSNSPEDQSESSPKVPSGKVPGQKVPSGKEVETERKKELTCQPVELHRDELRKQQLFLSASNPDLFSPPIKRRDLNSPSSHSVASSKQSIASPSLRQEWTKEEKSTCGEKTNKSKARSSELKSLSKKKTKVVPTKAAVKCMFTDSKLEKEKKSMFADSKPEKEKVCIVRRPVGPTDVNNLVDCLDELRIDDARYSRRIQRQSNNCFSGNKSSPKLHSPISFIFSEPKSSTPNPMKKFSVPSPSPSFLSPSLRNEVLQQNFYSNQLLYQLNLYNEFLAGQLSTPSHIHSPSHLLMPPLLASQLIWPKILSHLQSVAPVPIPGGHNVNFDSPRSYQSASPAGPKVKSPVIPAATASSSSRKEKKSKHKNHDVKSRSCSREEVKGKKKKSKKKETFLVADASSIVSIDQHRGGHEKVSNKHRKRKSRLSPSSYCATEEISGVKSGSRKSGKPDVGMDGRNEEGALNSSKSPRKQDLVPEVKRKGSRSRKGARGSRSGKGVGGSRSEREEGVEKRRKKEEKGREMKAEEQSEPFPSSLADKETTRFGCQQRLPFHDSIPCLESPLVSTDHDLRNPRSGTFLEQLPTGCIVPKPTSATVSTVDRIIEECSKLPCERPEEESSELTSSPTNQPECWKLKASFQQLSMKKVSNMGNVTCVKGVPPRKSTRTTSQVTSKTESDTKVAVLPKDLQGPETQGESNTIHFMSTSFSSPNCDQLSLDSIANHAREQNLIVAPVNISSLNPSSSSLVSLQMGGSVSSASAVDHPQPSTSSSQNDEAIKPSEVFVTEETPDYCTSRDNPEPVGTITSNPGPSKANKKRKRTNRTGWDKPKKKRGTERSVRPRRVLVQDGGEPPLGRASIKRSRSDSQRLMGSNRVVVKNGAQVDVEPDAKTDPKVKSEPKRKKGRGVKEEGERIPQYDPATAPFIVITAPSGKKETEASVSKQLSRVKKNLMYKLPGKKFHKSGFLSEEHKYDDPLTPDELNKSKNELNGSKNEFPDATAELVKKEVIVEPKVEDISIKTDPSVVVPPVLEEVRPEMSSDTDGSTSGKELNPQSKSGIPDGSTISGTPNGSRISATPNGSTISATPSGSTISAPTTDVDDPPRGTYKSETIEAFIKSRRRNSLIRTPYRWLHDPAPGAKVKKSNKPKDDTLDYELPYDLFVWKLEKNDMKNVCHKYRKLKQNTFADIKPISDIEENICDCKPPSPGKKGCGPDCLNRCMLIECDPKLCPCKETCSNQRMLKNQWAPGLQRFLTGNCGWGVRTTEKIKEGDFILEYIGEVVSLKLFRDRMVNMYHNDSHHYCMSLGPHIVIDGYRAANEGRFVNHSCEPNCVMQKWSVDGMYRMGLFAARDIEAGEELSYDYNFDSYNAETQQECRCGSKRCRGVIGGRSKGDRRGSTDTTASTSTAVKKVKRGRKSAKDQNDVPN